jgi:ubiquinone/menaquinone biosynthesis C-methylase UbiE
VLFANASSLSFPTGLFDIALCGFMGWSDCYDFVSQEFTKIDTKAHEIRRVLRPGGKFVCCAWEAQKDLEWMEETMNRHYPDLLQDGEYLEQRPIGAAYERPGGYEIIFRDAGLRDIEVTRETSEFISTNEEEWWLEMQYIGWDYFFNKIRKVGPSIAQGLKDTIFTELQLFKQSDGFHFTKSAFYVSGVK